MITIDGAKGEGGGQILRTSLSLAACLNKPIEIKNIRAGRGKPGLLRQHYTCAAATAEISSGKIEGLEVGSEYLKFIPGSLGGIHKHYSFAIGTAGSTSLVFQTILPVLLLASHPVRVELKGGTHVPYSPTLEFIEYSFLPVLASIGVRAEIELESCGFYPAGGGSWTVLVHPWTRVSALSLCERGKFIQRKANALMCNLSHRIGERELNKVNWGPESSAVKHVDGFGCGNVLSLQLQYENITSVFDSIGMHRKPAEAVAAEAVKFVQQYEATNAPVCEHLADQLLLPMVIGKGGRFVTQQLSLHSQTNIDVISQVSECEIRHEQVDENAWLIDVPAGLQLSP